MYERFTDRAREVMRLANEEAERFKHDYIGTEHILLGLIKVPSGVAADVLRRLAVDPREICFEVEKIVQARLDAVVHLRLPFTPRAKKVIEYAVGEARAMNLNYVGTEHLLLGLLRETEGVAAVVLTNLGLKLDAVCHEIMRLTGSEIGETSVSEASDARVSDPLFALLAKLHDVSIWRLFDWYETYKDHPMLRSLLEDIRELNEVKENAVASQEFERAAHARDQVDALIKKLRILCRELEQERDADAP